MTTVPNGIIGGILSAFVSVGLTRLIAGDRSEASSPAAGTGDHSPSRWWSVGASAVYGGVAGGALLLVERYVLGVLSVPPDILVALGTALAWSALLCVGWLAAGRVVSRRSDTITRAEVVLFHLLFGVSLGLWIRFTWIT
ncbi:MAG: hypothetical protein R3324_12705 [Halobacteriales archaeon]|nr:hypothetical protein [Halobacteriales archaeon]